MPDSSREEIAKLEALYANNPAGRVFTHLAEAYRKNGELERARGILDEGLQKHPGYASAYVVLGRVLMDLQQNEDSTHAFRQVLELDPHNLVALRSLGELARIAGNTDEARRFFEELRQQDPGNDEIEQIINDLNLPPTEQSFGTLAEERSITIEYKTEPSEPEWRPGGFFESEAVEAAEPSAEQPEVVAEASAEPAAAFEPEAESQPEPQPEPERWLSDYAEPTEIGSAAEPGPYVVENVELGWVSAQPETPPVTDELGDLTSIGKAAEKFEVEGETFAPEDLNLGVGEAELGQEQIAEASPVEGEVLTETIADLYRRQGLYDRALDVYHALLRERPDSPDLKAKIAEVEALAQPPADEQADEQPLFEPEPWEVADADEAAAWWAGREEQAESTPTPYAWAEQPSETTDSGRPISAYFRQLLAWQPRAGAAAPARAEATTAAEAFDEWFGGPESTSHEATSAAQEVSSSSATASAESAEGDDDDDLEMFRSWLQSLKK